MANLHGWPSLDWSPLTCLLDDCVYLSITISLGYRDLKPLKTGYHNYVFKTEFAPGINHKYHGNHSSHCLMSQNLLWFLEYFLAELVLDPLCSGWPVAWGSWSEWPHKVLDSVQLHTGCHLPSRMYSTGYKSFPLSGWEEAPVLGHVIGLQWHPLSRGRRER